MSLRIRIERLEREAGIHQGERDRDKFADMSDAELTFFLCHGCSPQELQGKITRHLRQYTDNDFRVTIIVEAVK